MYEDNTIEVEYLKYANGKAVTCTLQRAQGFLTFCDEKV